EPGDVGAQRDDDGDAEQQDDRGGALLFRIEEAHCDRVGPTGWARQALASCGLHERAVTSGPMDPTPAGLIMKKGVVIALLGILCVAPQAVSQQKTVTGKVTSEQGAPLSGVSVGIKGTKTRTATNNEGNYSVRAAVGQVLQFRLIGTALVERTVGDADVIDVPLRRVALDLDAVVVSALGEATERPAQGTAQQTIRGADIAQTQRENFVNALQGRIA